jgi:MoxR-like ATPase
MSEQRPDRSGNRKNGGGSGNGGRQPNGNSGLRFGRGLFGWVLFIALAVMLFMLLNKGSTQYASIPLSEFTTRLQQDRVETLTIETDKLLGQFRGEETIGPKGEKVGKFQTALPAGANNTWEFTRWILENRKNAEVKVENSPNWLLQVIIPLIPWLLIFGFIWFFVFRQLRNSAGAGGMLGNFGRSRHKITSKEHTNVTFEDVAGVEEAKDEVMEIVEFLKNPKKFQRLGGRIPRGVLLVGEPGTGKTLLASHIAAERGLALERWQVKSTTKAIDGLYHYDAVRRLHDSRFGDGDVGDIEQYIRLGPLGRAFEREDRCVVLIDEIDKADLEFPNDLLHELDAMNFTVMETGRLVQARARPIVMITSNNEKELPDAFLRRCVFHFIAFPGRELMAQIVRVHHRDVEDELLAGALTAFYRVRQIDGVRKPPSTSELIDWISALRHASIAPEKLLASGLPFIGTLLKKEGDVEVVRRRLVRGVS